MDSPVRNEQGQPKDLADVTDADLSQLADLEEGLSLIHILLEISGYRKKCVAST